MPAVPGKAGGVWYAQSLAILQATGTTHRGQDGQTLSVGDFGEVLKGVGYGDIPAIYTCATVAASASTWTAVNATFPGTVSGSGGGSNLFYDTKIYSFRRTNNAACWYSPIGWYSTLNRPAAWQGNAGYLIAMPHDGQLVRSIILTENDIGTSYIWWYKNFENPSTTKSGNLSTTALPSSAGHYIQKDWSGATFSALDHYSLHFNPTNTPGDILMMHTFEYDKST